MTVRKLRKMARQTTMTHEVKVALKDAADEIEIMSKPWPKGMTPTDARVLKQANFDLADEIEKLTARIAELEGQNKALVIKNKFLRERPDLPVDRIPIHKELTARIAELEQEVEEWKDTADSALSKAAGILSLEIK